MTPRPTKMVVSFWLWVRALVPPDPADSFRKTGKEPKGGLDPDPSATFPEFQTSWLEPLEQGSFRCLLRPTLTPD